MQYVLMFLIIFQMPLY